MKKILTAFILLLAALFTGCATADKLNDLRIGMSKDQVIAMLGKPDSTSAQANIEYLTYYLSNDSSYTYGRDQPYMVRLVDGKVESFGRFMQLFDIYNRPVGGNGMGQMITPMGSSGVPLTVVRPGGPDLATTLTRLKTLKDQGVLTDEEFQKAKARLLAEQK
ncbi:MAG TPA: SHOCT domain-containing protein [Opitutaceae bacterium]|nr:SHOCT domain-containing protein [Opitutaceae bacterium]